MKKFLIFTFLIIFALSTVLAQATNDIYEQIRNCDCTKEEKIELLDNYLKSASPQELGQLDIYQVLRAMRYEYDLKILFILAQHNYNVKAAMNDNSIADLIMRNTIANQNKQVLETFFDDYHWENTFKCSMLSDTLPQEFLSYILSKIKIEYLIKENGCLYRLASSDEHKVFEAVYKKVLASAADYNLEAILGEASRFPSSSTNFDIVFEHEGNKIWQIPFLHGYKAYICSMTYDNLKTIFNKIPKNERKNFVNLINKQERTLLTTMFAYKAQDLHAKMKLLLEFGADPNIIDIYGIYPLTYAVQKDDEDAVLLLLSYGADKNINAYTSSKPLTFIASPKIQNILGKDQNIIIMERIMKDKTQKIKNREEYAKLWPKNVQVFIIGETHFQDTYKNEIAEMQTIFRKKYPNLVLASEFLRTSEQDAVNKYLQGNNNQEVKIALMEHIKTVLDNAKNNGIRVFGLEKDNDVELDTDAASYSGAGNRNKNWIKKITEIINKDKNAKILLYCGKGHSDYNGMGENSLPKLLDKEGISYKVLHLAGQDKCDDTRAVCNAGFENEKTITKIPKRFVNSFGVDYILNIPKE